METKKSIRGMIIELHNSERITEDECKLLLVKLEHHDDKVYQNALSDLCREFRKDWNEQVALGIEDCINWFDWLKDGATKLIKGRKNTQ